MSALPPTGPGAEDDVRRRLADLPRPTMPSEVANRLDAVLRAQPPLTSSDDGRPVPAPGNVVPLRSARPNRRTWFAAAAACVLLIVVLVGAALVFNDRHESSGDTAARASVGPPTEDRAAAAPTPLDKAPLDRDAQDDNGMAEAAPRPEATTSGTDYRARDLAAQVPEVLRPSSRKSTASAPSELDRLTPPEPLASCLAAVRGSGSPQLVDYARFERTPALALYYPDADPSRVLVLFVGAKCGVDGAADELYRAVVRR